MGDGIELAAADNPDYARAIDNMKDQLIIVLIKRLGGDVTIPVAELDGTGPDLLFMSGDPEKQTFNFVIKKKS